MRRFPLAVAIGRSAFVGMCLLQWPLLAQSTGELRGTVVDSSGAPVPGALVEIRSVVLIRPRQTGSRVDGTFEFPILPPGPYSVLARKTGLLDATRDDVRVPLGETIAVRMELKLAAAASVTVDSDVVPVVDTSNAKLGLSVNERILANLPLGRNFASAASLAPGVGTDVLGPTVYGASSLENAFTTDNLNVTGVYQGGQGKLLPLEFVQEVEIRTGGYEAEFGRTLGGNINVVTKAGGSDFHGSVFGYYDSGSLASADQHGADRDAAVVDRLEVPLRYDLGLALGGPLVGDRLWFFGAYDRARVDLGYRAFESLTYLPDGSIQGHPANDRTDSTSWDLFAAKLSWAPNASHSASVSVLGDTASYRGRRELGPSPIYAGIFTLERVSEIGPESATVIDQRSGGIDVSGRWDGFLGPAIFQLQAGYHEEQSRDGSEFSNRLSIEERRQGVAPGQQFQFVEGSGPKSLTDNLLERGVLRWNGSAVLGSHEIKLGVDYESKGRKGMFRFGGGEAIRRVFRPDGSPLRVLHQYHAAEPLNCTVKTDGSRGNFGSVDPTTCNSWQAADTSSTVSTRSREVSVFLQDTYRPLSNLTVNVGIRHDYQQLDDTHGSPWLTMTDQWSPRVSGVWDPGGAGRSKVYLSLGRYYQSLPDVLNAVNEVVPGQEPPLVVVYNSSPGSNKVNDPAYRPSAAILSGYLPYVVGGLEGTYQDEVSVGGELQLGASWSVALRGVYRSLGSVVEDRCDTLANPNGNCAVINPGRGELGQLRDPSNPDCFEDFPLNKKPRPCESVRAARFYRGLEVVAQHRPTKDLYLVASYVLSRLSGNYEGFIKVWQDGASQAYPAQTSEFDDGPHLLWNSGRLANDRTHQLKLSGYYSLPFGLSTGLVASLVSGQPLSLKEWGGVADGTFVVPRGSYGELPSLYSIDLHLQYAIQVGKISISPVLDVFNVTDVQRVTGRYQIYDTPATADQTKPPYTSPTNPLFGKDVSWQAPRLVRLAVKASF